MYITTIDTKTTTGKVSHQCTLLRQSYRENGKVKNRTIGNLTNCKPNEIEAIRIALANKDNLTKLKSSDTNKLKQGQSVGSVWLIYHVIKSLGIEKAIPAGKERKLALWQIIARIINQGSRLSAVRLAKIHAACDVLGITDGFNEDHLYDNLSWLSKHQRKIEKRLFKIRRAGRESVLFLYDVTSSYFEGQLNEFGEYGYNRDKKKGKKQVVMGLLCDEDWIPVSVDIFRGNTSDPKTFVNQVRKVSEEFGCKRVTFVGDRGMIKSKQIEEIKETDFFYITAITKAQIEKLLRIETLQMELFDDTVAETESDGIRYILRRNPTRADEITKGRSDKKRAVERLCKERQEYLKTHPRARVECALKKIEQKIKRLKIGAWLKVVIENDVFKLIQDDDELAKQSELDGCYVIKSDLPQEIHKQVIHDRYKDLSKVEQAFRTCKTELLEMRPWYVRSEKSTKGLAVVLMLAYIVVHELQQKWASIDVTVEEGINALSHLCSIEVKLTDHTTINQIPEPTSDIRKLFEMSGVAIPSVMLSLNANVVTRKKLPAKRKRI
jgi:transposase